jgi:hypothetical protein
MYVLHHQYALPNITNFEKERIPHADVLLLLLPE